MDGRRKQVSEFERWRRGTLRMILIAGGAFFAGAGFFEVWVESGVDMVGWSYLFGGSVAFWVGRKEGG